ncbi:MAG: TM0106 family RecB-like putative nuclease, partial [bacterium]
SRFYLLLKDPFTLWCRYHAPAGEAVREYSRYDELKSESVRKMRRDWIKSGYPCAPDLEGFRGLDGLKAAVEAMVGGKPALRNARLWDLPNETYGTADILIRDDSAPSVFGGYYYRVVEFKSAAELKPHHSLQAALYNRMLGRIQGRLPEKFTVILNDSSEHVIEHCPVEAALDSALARWRGIRDGSIEPEPGRPPHGASAPWRIYANRILREKKDLVMLAGTGLEQRIKLRNAGFGNTEEVYKAGVEKIKKLLDDAAGFDVWNTALAYHRGKPVPKPGKVYSPARARRHLYFDFETSDGLNGAPPHTYLIGIWDLEKGRYEPLLSKGHDEEEKIFRDFIDYVGDLSQARLYHWTDYEIYIIKGLSDKYPALEAPLKGLVSSCIDLKNAVKGSFYLPAPSFSLKAVAPALGFDWRQKNVGAMESMVFYWDWLASGDGEAIRKVLDYNEDDCVAMVKVDQALSSIKPEAMI